MTISATSLSMQASLTSTLKSTSTTATSDAQAAATAASSSTVQETVSISSSSTSTAGLIYGDPRKTQAADDSSSTTSSGGVSDLSSMLNDSNKQVQDFINMMGNLLKQQGATWSKVMSGEQTLTADPKTVEAAKQAISDDGEFGIKNTAERILNFAKAAAGDDPAKLSQLRDAIQKGFDGASQFFGGKLPTISNQTHDVIMNELDKWAANGIPSGTVKLSTDDIAAVTKPKDSKSTDATAAAAASVTTTTTTATASATVAAGTAATASLAS